MNKMKKIILSLVIVLVVAACQQAEVSVEPTNTFTPPATTTETPQSTSTPTAFPTSELSPYYGGPQPAKVIINNEIYYSEIGTTRWIKLDSEGRQYIEIGDAFAIITPIDPIITKPSFSLTLEFQIPINPTELWYILYKVSEQELASQDSTHGALAWNPDYKTQTYIDLTDLPLLREQQLAFSVEPGIYVFEVNAAWGGTKTHPELRADFGFLFEVQE